MTGEIAQRLLDYSYQLISFRPRSISELRGRLQLYAKKKKYSPDFIPEIVSKLSRQGYLNDTTFAKWWIDQRLTFRQKGKAFLRMELLKKGVDKKIIDEALGQILPSDEFLAAQKVAEKYSSRLQHLSIVEAKKKLATAISRRGFSWEIIERVIDSLPDSSYNKGLVEKDESQ